MPDSKKPRRSKLIWVRIGDLHVSPKAQREFRKAHGDLIAAKFELEAIGFPIVSMRGGQKWIVDGQHRVYALKLNGFTDDDQIQVECYLDLQEHEEAELFLQRDERRRIGTFDRFKIGVVAQRGEEAAITNIVRDAGYRIAKGKSDGAIGATGALRDAYRIGESILKRTLHVIGSAWDGDAHAFTADAIKGMALVCERYEDSADYERMIGRLGGLAGGPMALKRKTESYKLRTGHNGAQCCAAAIVDVYNAGRGGRKLESWWA